MPYLQQHIDSALYHIEHGGLPSNKLAREVYYTLTSAPTQIISTNIITQEDRETTHGVLRIFRSKGGTL